MVVPQLGGETGEVDTKGRRKPRVLLMGPRRYVRRSFELFQAVARYEK
jgi:hypothetical protein